MTGLFCWFTGHVFWRKRGEYDYRCLCKRWAGTYEEAEQTWRFQTWKNRWCSLFRHPLMRRWWMQLPPYDEERLVWLGGEWRSACWCGETGPVESKAGLFLIGKGKPQ